MNIINKHIAFLFPGQGSQSVGMGKELAINFPTARLTFEEGDEILGFALSSLSWEGPEAELNDTINTQPALMVHSVASLRVLNELHPELKPVFTAGHSMGELSALVAADSLPFSEALRLVRTRGELMKRAGIVSPGGMAAIIGMDIPTLEEVCKKASQPDEIVQVANDNSPGQVVISGASPALQRALKLAQEAGARRAIPLAVSIAAHSPLMINAQEDFNQAVTAAPVCDPSVPLIGNVTALPLEDAGSVRSDLRLQLTSRVRWVESIRYMASQGCQYFMEIGNGSVLSGLVKRIEPQAQTLTFGSPIDFERLV